ncbi:MAG: response regulator [Rhodospirillales bacterium]|nr:response regulator [Rhodospirillales bacterium]
MKILVVDDDPNLRKLVMRFLQAKGFEAFEAANGAEGVEQAEKIRPRLVIMDLNMPVMNGFEATRRIKQADATKDTPVIVLTVEDALANYDEIYAVGADAFVAKPVDFERLLGRVLEYT